MTLPQVALSWSLLTNALDIALTACLVYIVLLIIRGTRAMQILQGIALLLILRVVAQYAHLWTILSVLNGVLIVSGLAIPIIFQPELRRALAQFGKAGFHEGWATQQGHDAVDRLCSVLGTAATVLSRSAIGAIIVVERNAALDEYIESGTKIDALVSPEVLLSLFSPRSPLHDGAAIIRRERVCAAGCFLPLSEAVSLDRRVGTRHRAALGVTEQTDAIALVISEETGVIALAEDGRLLEQPQNAQAIARELKASLTWKRGVREPRSSMMDYARMVFQRMHVTTNGLDKTKLRP